MYDVEVFYDQDSDPETFDARELIIKGNTYILRDYKGDRTVIPKDKVFKMNVPDEVEVIRED